MSANPGREAQGELKNPVLLGSHEGRDVVVDLTWMPSADGLVFVTYQDDVSRAEIAIGELRMTQLVDGDVL